MLRNNLLEELESRPLSCDGAMGTQLMARGLGSGECGMLWCVDRPGDLLAVHSDYRAAGCNLITTNSFGGTSCVLERHGLAERAAELNRAAASVARQAAGDEGWVLGDLGPFGDFLEPLGDMEPDELREIFQRQIEALVAGGADAILIETMSDPSESVVAIEAARSVDAQLPVLATFAFQKTAAGEFRTMMGSTVEDAMGRTIAAGAQVVGANCGSSLGLDDYVALASQLVAAAKGARVILQPNAGSPRIEGDKTFYDATPAQMADTAARLLACGVSIVGGCCGTTPAHLAAMSKVVAGR